MQPNHQSGDLIPLWPSGDLEPTQTGRGPVRRNKNNVMLICDQLLNHFSNVPYMFSYVTTEDRKRLVLLAVRNCCRVFHGGSDPNHQGDLEPTQRGVRYCRYSRWKYRNPLYPVRFCPHGSKLGISQKVFVKFPKVLFWPFIDVGRKKDMVGGDRRTQVLRAGMRHN